MAEAKSFQTTERNKMIAAIVLGVLALATLYMAFGPSFSGSRAQTTSTPTPTPRRSPSPGSQQNNGPSPDAVIFEYQSTPVVYTPGLFGAPDPGRNIFAFYEPPPPTPYVPPTPTPFVPPTPIPTPTPPLFVAFVTPQSVYAGSRTFRLEVNGDKFTPDSRIFLSQSPLPTTFISPQRLVGEVPANMIAGEGPRQIIVQTPDGKLYSNQLLLSVQAPPRPQFQYVGMIARRHANNDTAVLREQGRPTEFTARLGDVVGGRFRVVSIASNEMVVEDTTLGFRHRVELFRPPPPAAGSMPTGPGGRIPNQQQGFPQGLPQGIQQGIPQGTIPGIPANIPRYVPPGSNTNTVVPGRTPDPNSPTKQDEDGTDGN
ncbi:MAG: hypothetical protein KF762_18680 [Acidobacteria bacterium]|nr:hypothetical protein [Acidobacteriota bacterium]MBX3507042.1 hypothetical protein [Parvibaculum sp.]